MFSWIQDGWLTWPMKYIPLSGPEKLGAKNPYRSHTCPSHTTTWVMSSSFLFQYFALSITLVQVNTHLSISHSVLEAYQWFASCGEPSKVLLVYSLFVVLFDTSTSGECSWSVRQFKCFFFTRESILWSSNTMVFCSLPGHLLLLSSPIHYRQCIKQLIWTLSMFWLCPWLIYLDFSSSWWLQTRNVNSTSRINSRPCVSFLVMEKMHWPRNCWIASCSIGNYFCHPKMDGICIKRVIPTWPSWYECKYP